MISSSKSMYKYDNEIIQSNRRTIMSLKLIISSLHKTIEMDIINERNNKKSDKLFSLAFFLNWVQ